MSKHPQRNLFISSPFTSKQAGFYQDLLRGVLSYPQLGNRLIRLAEQACSCRQFDRVEEYGQLLVNIPLKPYQAIGCYFLGMMVNRPGNVNQDKAKRLFEMVLSNAPDAYKPKAILSLGALAFYKRDFETALGLYRETIRAGKLSVASLVATRGIVTVKSIEGYHQSAIADLENVMPMLKYAPGHIYFDLLNSYAVELGEVGRTYEARNISQFVINSPFAFAYPEWQDTANDLRGLDRSFVAFKPFKDIPRNVLLMPVREHEVEATQGGKPARVMSLQKWKEKMGKDKTDEPEIKNEREMLMWIMSAYTDDETTNHERYRMYEAVRKVIAERNNPKPDDDDTAGA